MKTLLTLLTLISTVGLSAQSYLSIEATEYDPSQDRWLTTNGNSIIAQDANGELSFFGNGSANYGMEVMNGTLFAIFNSNVKGYDLIDGTEVMSISISGAGFLNGMGSDPATNRLWVSDFVNSTIVELDVSDLANPSQQTVVSNTGSTPNGVVYDQIDDRVIFVSWGNNAAIKAIDLSDYSVTTLTTTSMGNLDGIDMTASGEFFVSSWSPQRITIYDHDFENSEVLTSSGLANPADISWAEGINTLGVANSGNETLGLFVYEAQGLEEADVDPLQVKAFPNPATTSSAISFELKEASLISYSLMNLQGRALLSENLGTLSQGTQRLILDVSDLESGQYMLILQAGAQRSIMPLVVLQ